MKLNEENVESLVRSCLFKEEDNMTKEKLNDENSIIVKGINNNFAFKKEEIEKYKDKIAELVNELDDTFDEGWTFLNMHYTKDKKIWTGFYYYMDSLLCLGLAVGVLEYCAPRDKWEVLPGGMPYIKRIKR